MSSPTAHTLMFHAAETASIYMEEAVKCIDNLFGDGYAKKHPDLVGIFMKTAAKDFETAVLSKRLHSISESILNRYLEED